MWSLWEESQSQISVKHKMWKLGSWQMFKNRELLLGFDFVHFEDTKCKGIMEETVDSIAKLCDEVETVNGFCYFVDRLNASGGCEAAVTARVRIGWVRLISVVDRQLICALCDKNIKICMYIPLRPKLGFRRVGIEFSDLGGPAALFLVPLILGVIARPSNFEKPYLHFQRSNFYKFDIKLFRKKDLSNKKKQKIIQFGHFFI